MLRTLEEVVDLINKKEHNANLAYNREWHRTYPNKEMLGSLRGEMMAYQDCKILIQSSHLLDEDGRIEEAKNLISDFRKKGMNYMEILNILGLVDSMEESNEKDIFNN